MINQSVPSKEIKQIILVIEDDPNVQSIYQELLSKEGYKITLTDTVDKACDSLSKSSTDLILLDIMLPGGKNGYDFLEIIQKNDKYKNIPVIVLSNLDQDRSVSNSMGVVAWLVKANVSSQDVVAKVNQVINKSSK